VSLVIHTELDPQPGSVIAFNASANDDGNGDETATPCELDRQQPSLWADTRVYGEVTAIDQP